MKIILLALALMISGCSSKYVQITKTDGTEYLIDISEVMKDQKADKVTVTVNPSTGEHTLVLDNINNETSPFVQAMGQALLEAYKAGRAGI
jgi:hypothetical protein